MKIVKGDTTARLGQSVELRARVSDPDRDPVRSTWTVYTEASTVAGTVSLAPGGSGKDPKVRVTVPADATKGQRIVLNLTATDDGAHTLTSYGQVVITVG